MYGVRKHFRQNFNERAAKKIAAEEPQDFLLVVNRAYMSVIHLIRESYGNPLPCLFSEYDPKSFLGHVKSSFATLQQPSVSGVMTPRYLYRTPPDALPQRTLANLVQFS
jgi:hypothetical protein